MAITILEGSTFCICDERGDIDGETQGLFADDTRFLSLLRLTVNGEKPLLLSQGKVEYFSAAFYLRNPLAGGLPQDSLSITRHRFVGEGMQDRVVVQNVSMEPLACKLALELGTDFADILSVKEHDFALGDPARAAPLPPPVGCRYEEEHNQFVLEEADGAGRARTQVILSDRGAIEGAKVVYDLELEPRESWELRLDMLASIDGDAVAPRAAERRFGEEMTRVRESLAAWQLRVPQIRADWDQLARAPIAPCEVQGYVYDAKLRTAELAREVWRDRVLAERLEHDAEELRRAFNDRFWSTDRGGYYVLALDGEKRQVDALCSNVGHLLWSGIVPTDRVDAIVDSLMGEQLWSGWGVRTMSTGDAGYNPLAYHNGTVWPHDNSLIAHGLARHARWPEAQRIVRRMLSAAAHFNYQLPEVFAGLPRAETPFPIAYPTAARPQAWAAGTPVLLLQVLLGLEPDRRRHQLETRAPEELPSWAGRSMRLSGIRAFDRLWDVRVDRGRVVVEEA